MRNQNQRGAAIYAYCIPLTSPIRSAGVMLAQREGLLLRLDQGSDRSGWGEAAPLPGFSIETLAQSQQDLITQAKAWLNGSATDPIPVLSPSARFGFSCALHELDKGPLSEPGTPVSYPLLQDEPEAMLQQWRCLATTQQPASLKLKLARRSLAREIALVQALLRETPELRLRIDCNQGWTLQQAQQFLTAIPRATIDYLEEPCRDLQQSLELTEQTGVALALDESLRLPGFILPKHPALAALILKPSLTGSLQQLRDWIELGQKRGVRVILSSSYESSLGLAQIAALATQLTPAEAPGLDTARAFSRNLLRGGDPAKPTLTPHDLTCLWRS
ncbi:MAG: o-succinylbenzoate synthase [Motiliproteus sp.]